MSVIELQEITFRRNSATILDRFSLSVQHSEVLAIVGPSGVGKSTVLRVILGLALPESGAVRINQKLASDGQRLHMAPERRNISIVFQDLALWPHMTVRGNLEFGLEAQRVTKAERLDRIGKMLQHLGLAGKADRPPGTLSGGERQRVAIARALVSDPIAVLFDEPLSSLDVVLKRELLSLFHELLHERGIPALYVTHDVNEVAGLADRIAVMENGRIAQVGTLCELKSQPISEFVRAITQFVGTS